MKPNGYFIPADWEPITDGLAKELYEETGEHPDYSDLATALVERFKMPMAGFVYSDALSYPSLGYFWSSTVYSSSYAYYLGLSSTVVDPVGSSNRYIGRTVRCLAR